MFEGHETAAAVVALVERGDLATLWKLVERGCLINRRTRGRRHATPLDIAAGRGDLPSAAFLLDCGAPIEGSSLFDAISADAVRILELFHGRDREFHRLFLDDSKLGLNPRLDRWLTHYTALDYAQATGARSCATFLKRIGAPDASVSRVCVCGGYAPHITQPVFVCFGGMGAEGLFDDVHGYHCVRCGTFECDKAGPRGAAIDRGALHLRSA